MPYVHLANGEHRKVDEKTLAAIRDASGNATHLRDAGTEHFIVGVYPDEVEYEMSDEEKATVAENGEE